jgi:hypothetical protein
MMMMEKNTPGREYGKYGFLITYCNELDHF